MKSRTLSQLRHPGAPHKLLLICGLTTVPLPSVTEEDVDSWSAELEEIVNGTTVSSIILRSYREEEELMKGKKSIKSYLSRENFIKELQEKNTGITCKEAGH